MIAVWLFLTIPRVCLQFVIVVFPYNSHYFGKGGIIVDSANHIGLEGERRYMGGLQTRN